MPPILATAGGPIAFAPTLPLALATLTLDGAAAGVVGVITAPILRLAPLLCNGVLCVCLRTVWSGIGDLGLCV